jgi:protein-tyrosine phosphatase
MPSILIVCTANICRSPVGEALLKDKLEKRGILDWSVKSAGTWAQVIRGASQYSVEIMAEQGFDITNHQAEMLDISHMEDSDLILCMESGHREALMAEFPLYANKVHLVSEMIGKNYNISDPYGQPKRAYYRMVDDLTKIIDEGVDRIIEAVEAQQQKE